MISLPVGKLAIMGQIDVLEHDGECVEYPRALLISFEDTDSIRAAIRSDACRFWFGEEDPNPHAIEQQRDELLAALKSLSNAVDNLGHCEGGQEGRERLYETANSADALIARIEASK